MSHSEAEQLRQRNRDLAILNAIAQALNREVDLNQAMRTTLDQVVALFNLKTAWIWLVNESTGVPYLAAARHLPPALENNPRSMDGAEYCYCLEIYEDEDMDDATNISIITCSRLKNLVDGTDGLRSHAMVPLYDAHKARLGLLNVVSSDWRKLTERELQMLYTVGDMLSIAIERARLFDQSIRYGALEERNRLAREIHDGLAQGLTAIALRLETADALLDANAEADKLRKMIAQALMLTQTNLEDARRSVLDLRAAPLEGRTLAEAVEALAREQIEAQGIHLTFVAREQRPLSPRIEVGLYRVAQETFNNILKHADAQNVTIELRGSPEQIILIVEDDGIGFDPDACGPEERFGLVGQNERVKLLGGRMDLSSATGEGTRIEVTIPLDRAYAESVENES